MLAKQSDSNTPVLPIIDEVPKDMKPDWVTFPVCNRMNLVYLEIANSNLDLVANHN